MSNGGCALRCVNSIGSYTCACPVGQVHSQASNACVGKLCKKDGDTMS